MEKEYEYRMVFIFAFSTTPRICAACIGIRLTILIIEPSILFI
jgi:hypothetical protein